MKSHAPPLEAARSPTLLERLATAAVARWRQLPPATNGFTVTRNLRIPMRDGVVLLADVYSPIAAVKGTLLLRSPYGWQLAPATLAGSLYAARGYRVVLGCCRGTFGSGGAFEPMMREVEDGLDTVAWMREQPWFDGRFATLGASYVGFTQWALLMDPPKELAAAVIAMAPHVMHTATYPGGAFALDDFLSWSDQVAHQEDPLLQRVRSMASGRRRLSQALESLPLLSASDRLLQGRSPWFRDWLTRREATDPMWMSMNLEKSLERVQIPVLLQAGWQDLFLDQTLAQYARLAARNVNVALTVGAWNHLEYITAGGRLTLNEAMDWIEHHLVGSTAGSRTQPVKVFVNGPGGGWRDLPSWPPATTERSFYPMQNGALGDRPAPPGSLASFTYDPADPTPTVGGRTLIQGGYTDDSRLAARSDVLAFTGPILAEVVEFMGTPVVELAHASDNPHADIFVRLCEVDAQGRSHNISDGFQRLDSAAANGVIRLTLDATAHRFAVGNRLRLLVAGGCHPRWARNLGTGEDPATSTRMISSQRSIDLGASRLLLPVGRT